MLGSECERYIILFWTHFPQIIQVLLRWEIPKSNSQPSVRGKVVLSENNFHAWKLPWLSVLTWVVFCFIYQTNKSTSCPMYSIYKSYLLLKKGHSLKEFMLAEAIHPHSSTGAIWISPLLCWGPSLTNKSHWLDYWRLLLHTHVFVSLSSMHIVAVTYLPCSFPSNSSAILKKTQNDTP